jgi:hypothetical protein
MRQLILILVLLYSFPLTACGGGSNPQAPTPPPSAPPAGQPWTLAGRITATLGGQAVAGAQVDAFIASATSDAAGWFTLTAATAPTGSRAVTVSANGYRPRETVIRLPRADDVVVDIMSTAAPFNETFYNQLARDALDTPDADYPLFRWTSGLRFYLKTVDEFGRPLGDGVLDVVRRGLRDGVHYYTAGTYDAVIEEGTEDRPERVGYVNVVARQAIPEGDFCGLATTVGGNPMTIKLRIDRCGCGSVKIPIDVVMHEVGHAVGMFHVADRGQIMNTDEDFKCREVVPSALEQHHAALIYSRPRGNRSPDRDPGNFTLAGPQVRLAGAPGRP